MKKQNTQRLLEIGIYQDVNEILLGIYCQQSIFISKYH